MGRNKCAGVRSEERGEPALAAAEMQEGAREEKGRVDRRETGKRREKKGSKGKRDSWPRSAACPGQGRAAIVPGRFGAARLAAVRGRCQEEFIGQSRGDWTAGY